MPITNTPNKKNRGRPISGHKNGEVMDSGSTARRLPALNHAALERYVSDLLADIRGLASPPKIVVLAVNPEVKASALAAGADAFVSKNVPSNELLRAIRSLKKTMETKDIEEDS